MATKEPAAKLSLAVRKNVRDEFENEKPKLEAQLSECLGVPWTIDINPNAIFPYAEENSYGSNSLGACIKAYVAGAIWRLNYFNGTHGDAGKAEINAVAPNHVLTLAAGTGFSYGGVKFENGNMCMVFTPDKLGTNIDNTLENLEKALNSAPQPAGAAQLSYAARHSIKTDYEPKIEALLEKARGLLKNDKLEFDPDFEAQAAALKAGGSDVRDDWETNLGDFTRRYYESFVYYLDYEKFGTDDMLQEGFAEACASNKIKMRVIDGLKCSYNEIVLDGDSVALQTKPSSWGTNIDQVASKIVDIL